MVGDPKGPVAGRRPTLVVVAAVSVGFVLAVAYMVGRRAGRLRSTVVEVRRF